MIDLTELQRRFPHQKIKSQPAEGCGCGGTGVRHIKSLNMDRPCLCVCMSAPEPGEKEYRAELAKAVGQAARMALEEMMRDTWGCASIAPRHALEFARTVERAHGITQEDSPAFRGFFIGGRRG